MEHNHTQFAAIAAPARAKSGVTFLRCNALVNLNPDPIHEILAMKGEEVGEAMICRVLEDIAKKLDLLQTAKHEHNFDDIGKPARRIVHVSTQIGLVEVTKAATHAAIAAQQEDGIALSATLARLERAFDVAVTEVWRYRDYL